KQYDDDAELAKTIVSSQRDFNFAGKMEKALREKWLQNGKTERDVFELLKLNEEGTTLLKTQSWKFGSITSLI
ncbi:hypothetical protein L915_07923, partial [Phytophthora nicotianae]